MPAQRTSFKQMLFVTSGLVAVAVVLAAGAANRAAGSPPSPAYTMTSTLTLTPAGGTARLAATHVRCQRADGLFSVFTTYPGEGGAPDRTAMVFGMEGVGSYALDAGRDRLVYRGPLPEGLRGDVARELRADPRFDREEAVAGIAALVLREADEEGGGFTETFHAPSLAGQVVKRVRESARGREVYETTSFVPGEPDPARFAAWRHPADYAHYALRVERERGRGRPREAAQMTEGLEHARRLKP